MEENSVTQTPTEGKSPPRRSPIMLVFWITLIMVAGFASVGYYIDLRLSSLEEKVLLQNTAMSAQSDSTLAAIQNTRKDILGNRAESAKFSQTFSDTIDEMSGLLTNAVSAFSKQTQLLTQAVELQEQNQTELLQTTLDRFQEESLTRTEGIQTAIARLSDELTATKEAALSAKTQAGTANQNLALLNEKISQIGQDFTSGLTTLTELSQQMNETVGAQFKEQIQTLTGKMDELRTESGKSLAGIQTSLTAISTGIETESNILDRLNKTVYTKVEESLKADKSLDAKLETLAVNVDLAFAEAGEDRGMLRADIAEMDFALEGRADDMLVKLAASHENGAKTNQSVETKLDTIAQALTRIDTTVTESASAATVSIDTFAQTTSGQIEKLNGELSALSEEMNAVGVTMLERLQTIANTSQEDRQRFQQDTAATVEGLKQLTEQVVSLHSNLLENVAATRTKAAAWMEDTQSQEAWDAFNQALDNLTQSVESALNRVDTIKTEVSKFAAHYSKTGAITEAETPPVEGSEPIGMVPLQPEQEGSE